MCEQAARYCRAGVQRLLRKPPPALRGLDGLLRWVVARMSDKAVAERELLSPGAAAAAAAQRKGTSVILDVSVPRGRRRLLPPSLPARILHRLGSGVSPRGRRPPAGRARGCSPGAVPPWPGSRAHPSSSGWALFPGWLHLPARLGKRLHPGSCIRLPGSRNRRLPGTGAHRGSRTLLAGSCTPRAPWQQQQGHRSDPASRAAWGWEGAQPGSRSSRTGWAKGTTPFQMLCPRAGWAWACSPGPAPTRPDLAPPKLAGH